MPAPVPLDPDHVRWQKELLDQMPLGAFYGCKLTATILRKVSASTATISGLFPDAVETMRRHVEAAGYQVVQARVDIGPQAKAVRKRLFEDGDWPSAIPYPIPEDQDDAQTPEGP